MKLHTAALRMPSGLREALAICGRLLASTVSLLVSDGTDDKTDDKTNPSPKANGNACLDA
ncbi:MAG: hypothetical protein V3R46_00680 [Thermoplasmata archaeon]